MMSYEATFSYAGHVLPFVIVVLPLPVHINWLRVHPGCAVCPITAEQDALILLRHR